MKIKQRPEDFQVEELTEVTPGVVGAYAFYRLSKTNWTTPDALNILKRAWRLPSHRLHYGGLKDRHAQTRQYFTILQGPRRDFETERITVQYLGQVLTAYEPQAIRANRFQITIRDLQPAELQQAIEALAAMEPIGVPNYFDDQRFGSLGPSGRFIGRALVDGQFEDALQLAICETHPTDRGPVRKLKSLLRDHWGAWEVLKTRLPRCNERSLVDYLIHHPQDFRGAFARLPLELSSIYLSAYQSYLWNRQLDIWIQNRWPANALGWIVLKSGRHAAPRMNVPDGLPDWERATLPLPSARLKTSNVALDEVLAQEGLTLAQIRVAGLERPYFSKGDRSVCLRPTQVQSAAEDDALNRGRQCCHLSFELPRGSYATMILKRLTALE